MRLLAAVALAGALVLAFGGGVYDTKVAQQQNSSGAFDNVLVRTNKLTGEVCERYEGTALSGPSHWSCN
jgi:hypothetical protein